MDHRKGTRLVLLQVRKGEEEKMIERRAFLRAAGLEAEDLETVDVLHGTPGITLLDAARGLIIGGSRYSVFEDVPNYRWMTALVQDAADRGIPILGVCFGAQLIAAAFGGEVVRDKANEELGTYAVRRLAPSEGDVLLGGLPQVFHAQCAHQDTIIRLPEGAAVLAESDLCPVQAFRMPGGRTYGVQFHPERSKADFQRSIARRRTENAGSQEMLDAAHRGLRETPEAESVARRFAVFSAACGRE